MSSGFPADGTTLAPGTRQAKVDPSAPATTRSAENRAADSGARPQTGQREPTLGLPADSGRNEEARGVHFGHRHPHAPSPLRIPACPASRRALLEAVPLQQAAGIMACDFFFVGDGAAEDGLCPLLY